MVWPTRVAPALLAVALGASPACLSRCWSDEFPHIHASTAPVTLKDLTSEQRIRVGGLYNRIFCDCPREDYSKTLAGCPDPCANPQKHIVHDMVREGESDEEIFRAMLARKGDQRVLAAPEGAFGKVAYVLPFLAFVLGSIAAVIVVRRWRAGGNVERARRREAATILNPEEIERVERELAELE